MPILAGITKNDCQTGTAFAGSSLPRPAGTAEILKGLIFAQPVAIHVKRFQRKT
jgi:hypothetical protein